MKDSKMQFSFNVASADDARLAAEVCDFLADRMVPGAAPAARTRRSATKAAAAETPPVTPVAVTDAAELYAALAGGAATVAEVAPVTEPVKEPEVETAILEHSRDDRIVEAREAIKKKGGLWFGEYVKAHHPDGKKLSDYTDAELAAVHSAATAA